MAHLLTDEAFALTSVHFRRLGRADPTGYWIAAIGSTFIPWNLATILGVYGGQFIPDPKVLGLDVIFPAAMAGLAVGLSSGRRDAVAAATGVICAVVIGLLWDSRLGIVVGGVVGPLVGLAIPAGPAAGGTGSGTPTRCPPTPGSIPSKRSSGDRGRAAVMTTNLVGLALLMALVTYPSRAIPLLAPGFDRLPPRVLEYLRLVGPAVLAAIAAANIFLVPSASGSGSVFSIDIELLAVLACVADRRLAAEPVARPDRGRRDRGRRPGRRPGRLSRPRSRPAVAGCPTEGPAGQPSRTASASISTRSERSIRARTSTIVAAGPIGPKRSPRTSRTAVLRVMSVV